MQLKNTATNSYGMYVYTMGRAIGTVYHEADWTHQWYQCVLCNGDDEDDDDDFDEDVHSQTFLD